ncbi:hypothetical protein AGMMS50229_12070 [Campylobacterota bacterium]|nr:hypothetical protein AGMMS50229_12070 [Campylobacterota bacterium]
MYIDGDRLVVSIDSDLSEVQELFSFIKPRLEFIEGIDIDGGDHDSFMSSSLFGLLASMKVSKPTLDIPLFDDESFTLSGVGKLRWEAPWTKSN